MYAACCCNPPTCIILTDDTTLANYTQVSGTWTKPSTYIQTTSANAIIVHDTAHPDGLSTGAVRIGEVLIPAAGGTFRILFAYLDSSNYLFLEYEVLGPPGPTAGVDMLFRMGYRQSGTMAVRSLLARS